jgi:hypothetical protein
MQKILASLINTSILDLESAKVLYSQKLYHTSLFCFQQSMEKAYKTSALVTGQIQLSELRSIGHDYFNLLKKTFQSTFFENGNAGHTMVFGFLFDGADISKDEVDNTINESNRKAFFSMTENDLKNFINSFSAIKQQANDLFFSNIGHEKFLAIANSSPQPNLAGTDNPVVLQPDDLNLEAIRTFTNHIITIHMLGILTSPHSEQARYTFFDKDGSNIKSPVEIYTMDMPIIKNLEYLMNMAEEAISYLKTEVESIPS